MADYQFTISLSTFDASLLPPGSPPKGGEGFSAAVHKFLQEQFAGFKGDARIVVSKTSAGTILRMFSPAERLFS